MGDQLSRDAASRLEETLRHYADLIGPWAQTVARYMVTDVARRNLNAWKANSMELAKGIRVEMEQAPTGSIYAAMMDQQVGLIKSLPLDAAKRVHHLATENIVTGARSQVIADELLRTGKVTASKAKLIARTEVARAAATFTQARATYAGSTGYIWRTSKDGDVRDTHRAQDGKFILWSDPPKTDKGLAPYHAGCGPNCFPGSVEVNLGNGYLHGWRSTYTGPLALVRLDGGVEVTATPNHPMLTQRGWIAVQDLQSGDHLVQALHQVGQAAGGNVNQAPTTFQDVFDALGAVNAPELYAGFDLDLYGRAPVGQVHEVRTDWLLGESWDTNTTQSLKQLTLAVSNGVAGDALARVVLEVLHACGPGLRRQLLQLFGGHGVQPVGIGARPASQRDTMALEYLGDGSSGSAKRLGQTEAALAFGVAANQLALLGRVKQAWASCRSAPGYREANEAQALAESVRRHANGASGVLQMGTGAYKLLRLNDVSMTKHGVTPVFTIETLTGWYGVTGSSIVAKNCRCYADPVFPND